MSDGPLSLLLDGVYHSPVGHAIESLRYALGYHRADPELRIELVLNAETATELADLCPFVAATHTVPVARLADEQAARDVLRRIPREWDYIAVESRCLEPERLNGPLREYHRAAREYFRARLQRGQVGAAPPSYQGHPLRLELPAEARERTAQELSGRQAIAIMPAGSSASRWLYPSASSWELIVRELAAQHPDAVLCLVGKLARDGRTSTSLEAEELERILSACRHGLNAFDRPLIQQLALVEQCKLFVSPHTGFGMAAVSVGTPWLTLSGGMWAEQFPNGVPFYSVLPDRLRFPCYTLPEPLPVLPADGDGEGPRTPSMCRARIEADLEELLAAARALLESRWSYEDCLARHFPAQLGAFGGDRSRIGSFDGSHSRYV